MKRFLLLPLLLFALALPACAVLEKVGDGISVATSTITNPVDSVDIYRLKNTYAATLELGAAYRQFCWSKPYAVLMADPVAKPICRNRRPVFRQIQLAQVKAGSAVRSAERFVQNNPTLNATSAISAAWQAVTDFQSAVPRVQ